MDGRPGRQSRRFPHYQWSHGYGTTWAVGVRGSTIQCRHQKVIEESSSTVLDAAAEQAIRDAAVRLMSAAGYRNALRLA